MGEYRTINSHIINETIIINHGGGGNSCITTSTTNFMSVSHFVILDLCLSFRFNAYS